MRLAREGRSVAQAAHWKAFRRREKKAVRSALRGGMLARGKAVHVTVVPQSDGEEHCTPERPSHALWPRHLRDHLAALLPGDASYTLCPVRMQRLEPFVALLLIRQRPTHTAGSGQHWALGAAVTSLPSGVLAMVCEAMMKLESKLDVRPGS